MTPDIETLTEQLARLLRERDLPTAARLLRRIDFELAREFDRRNAPRSVASARARR